MACHSIRRFWRSGSGFFFSFLILFALPALGNGDFLSLQRRVVEVFEENRDAVVRVKGAFEGVSESGDRDITLKIGTGFFISREGHILANATRTQGASRIWVEHRGVDYAAEYLGGDSVNNIALLRLVALPEAFSVIRMGESMDLPKIGSTAVAISHYLDFDAAPNIGLVQTHARRYGNSIFPTTFLRISIPNDLGEGGSPILDLNGRLIGMMIAALPDIRASFALPTRAVSRIRDDLLFEGEVKYSWIGIEVKPEVDFETGRVIVNAVMEGTPAANAGIREGDALLRLGEFEIERVEDYPNASFFVRPGEFVSVAIMRGEELLNFNFRVERRPVNEALIVTNPRDELPPVVPPPNPDAGAVPPSVSPRADQEPESEEISKGEEDAGPPVPRNRRD